MTTITWTLVWILRWASDSASTTSGYESERPSDYNSVSSGDYASVLPATISTGRPRLRTGRFLRHRLAGCYCQGASPPQRLAGNLPLAEVASPYRPYPCRLVDFAAAKSTTAPRLPRSNQARIFKKTSSIHFAFYLQPGGNG